MVTEERRRILNMLASGKLSASEAEHLLDVLEPAQLASNNTAPAAEVAPRDPKFLRVVVDSQQSEHGMGKVNVRVPFTLIRAGMRLAALLPAAAHEPINRALRENGVDIDISKIKPENLEDLVTHLRELTVDVENQTEKVRVFCE
ncbi:MAG: hypothetical protein RL701_2224 [Pseudomonadota bacterium]|jgi:hypothetical protein